MIARFLKYIAVSLVVFFFPNFTEQTLSAQAKRDTTIHGPLLMEYVKGIEGKSHDERNTFVKEKLREFGVKYWIMDFDTTVMRDTKKDAVHGENIIVTTGSGKQKITVGAHYDAVPRAPGANDNGGGVAVILELIRMLKDKKFNHTIDFCFFDKEEDGLIGSAVYVHRYDTTYKHLAMINLDVEGTGNELYVGPVSSEDDVIMKYIHAARDSTKFIYNESEYYPGSDNESFANAHLENISISVVPHGDAEKLAKWVKSGYKMLNTEDTPEVLKVMHTPEDKSKYMTDAALNISYEFTKTTLLLLDRGEDAHAVH
jgi:Zn-dependent M28 family amino/carboxypeptidase